MTPPPDAPGRHARPHCAPIAALAALVLLLCAFARPVFAQTSPAPGADEAATPLFAVQQSDYCALALSQAERRYRLPRGLLSAIAKAESGRPITSPADIRPWPWTIDADGTGLFLDSKAAAVAWM